MGLLHVAIQAEQLIASGEMSAEFIETITSNAWSHKPNFSQALMVAPKPQEKKCETDLYVTQLQSNKCRIPVKGQQNWETGLVNCKLKFWTCQNRKNKLHRLNPSKSQLPMIPRNSVDWVWSPLAAYLVPAQFPLATVHPSRMLWAPWFIHVDYSLCSAWAGNMQIREPRTPPATKVEIVRQYLLYNTLYFVVFCGIVSRSYLCFREIK